MFFQTITKPLKTSQCNAKGSHEHQQTQNSKHRQEFKSGSVLCCLTRIINSIKLKDEIAYCRNDTKQEKIEFDPVFTLDLGKS